MSHSHRGSAVHCPSIGRHVGDWVVVSDSAVHVQNEGCCIIMLKWLAQVIGLVFLELARNIYTLIKTN